MIGQAQFTITDLYDGESLYTWVKYADDINGTNMSDSAVGKTHMGIATNKTSQNESNLPGDYTWSLIKGEQGDPGLPGKGIVSSTVTYQLHTSGTTAPTGTWSSTIPAPIKGRYMWVRTIFNYTDNTSITTYAVSYIPTDGQTGKGISSTTITYQLSTSGTTTPTGTWSSTVPTPIKGQFLWTRTIIGYTDGTSSISYSTSYYATDGQKGDTGAKGDGYEIRYIRQVSQPDTPTGNAPTGWDLSYPSAGFGNVWFSETTKDSTGNVVTSWSPPALYEYYDSNLLSNHKWATGTGGTGIYGINGTAAEQSRELGTTPFGGEDVIWKAISADTTSDSEGGWNATIPIDHTKKYRVSVWFKANNRNGRIYLGTNNGILSLAGVANGNPYFWNNAAPAVDKWYLAVGYINGSGDPSTTTSPLSGLYDGETGVKIQSATDYKSAVGATTHVHRAYHYYNTNIDEYVEFWNPRFDLADGKELSIEDLLRKGKMGPVGNTGTGISSATVTYQNGTSGTAAPTSTWSSSIPAPIKGQYLWTRTVTAYTDGTSATTYSVSYTATDGQAGKGISSTAVAYQLNTSGTTAPSGTWVASPPTPVQGQYLWTRTVITYTDGSNSTTYSTAYNAKDGQKGDQGDAGISVTSIVEEYYHSTSATTQTGGTWTTTVPVWTNGKYVWTRAKTSFSNGTISTTNPVNVTGGKGTDGTTTYTWIKYADTATGSGISDSPDGKRFMGVATNQTSSTESNSASAYSWSPLYDNVQTSSRNLVQNGTFRMGNDYWGMPASYGYASTPELDKPNSGIMIVDNTSEVSVNSPIYNDKRVYLTPKVGDTITFTTDFYCEDYALYGPTGSIMTFRRFAEATGGAYIQSVFSPSPTTFGFSTNAVWERKSTTYTFTASTAVAGWYAIGLYVSNGVGTLSTVKYQYREIEVTRGNIGNLDWTPAPEDVQAELDKKAATGDMEALAGIVSSMSSIINNKAGLGEFQSMEEAFNARVAQDIIDKDQVAADLATIEGRTTLIETLAGENKIVTEFIETVITQSEEGIFIANGESSTGILISDSRISFMQNDVEVAYISNQTMQISHGIFVETATIANFKFEVIPGTTILAITWVGD